MEQGAEKGAFIVLEGIDGSGKSSQIDPLARRLAFATRMGSWAAISPWNQSSISPTRSRTPPTVMA